MFGNRISAFSRAIGVRIACITIVLAVTTFATIVWVDSDWHDRTMGADMERTAAFVAELMQLAVEEPMLTGNDPGTRHQFKALAQFEQITIHLTDNQGGITYSTDQDVIRVNLVDLYPVAPFDAMFAGGLHGAVNEHRFMDIGGSRYFVKVATIANGPSCVHCHGASKPFLGAMVLFHNVDERLADFRQFNLERTLLLLGGLVLLLTSLLIYIRGSVVRRVRRIEQAAGEVMRGNLDADFGVGGRDELARLAEHLTDMVAMRKRAETVLETLNRNLEGVVRERTSELREKADELQAAYGRLQELDRMKTAFLATVSHELRTPMTSILGFARLIRRRFNKRIAPLLGEGSEAARLLERMEADLAVMLAEGDRLTGLVANMISLSDVISGQRGWNIEAVPVAPAVDEVLDKFEWAARDKRLALSRKFEPGLPPLATDASGLDEVLSNLVSNAVKFTREGGITVLAEQRGDMVRIGVADTGPGVREEDRERIFERFTQLGDYLVDKPGGTGIGLSLCREIVEQLGGRISVEPALGGGSLFLVELPVWNGPAALGAAADGVPESR